MKIIKKIFLIITLTTIFSVSAFAKSGFEFHYNALIGAGVGFPTKSMKDLGFKSDFGFDATSLFQLGYMHQVKEGFGISYLLELGYNLSSYSIMGKLNISDQISSELDKYGLGNIDINRLPISTDVSISMYSSFYNIQIGLFPKFNFGNFSIGIGGGIKIPIAGEQTVVLLGYEYNQKLNRGNIVDFFNPPIFGYVKTSFDYSFYLAEKIALDVGLYLGYDIMKFKEETGKDEYGGTLNFGIVFGVKFGEKVD